MKLFSRFFILLNVVVITACLAGIAGAFFLYYWGQEPFDPEPDQAKEPITYSIERGQTLKSLSRDLESEEVISYSLLFQLWVKTFSDFRKFQAGTYKIIQPVSPAELVDTFIKGEIFSEPLFEINIPEGFTLDQIVERFVDKGIGTREEFIRLATSQNFLRSLSISAPSIEGFLYPATYKFYEDPDEAMIYAEMVNTFWKRLPENYEAEVASRGITLNQAVIIASLIEAETSIDEEKPFVSEVIWRRLEKGMTLGIDAAVIYGAIDYNGQITNKHLEDRSNPYNLRIYKGLPPTPITSPSVSSLKAVLTPSNKGYLYYVLDPDDGKKHTFTKTLKEHNKAVAKLVRSGR